MSALAIGGAVFGCLFGGALLGLFLRRVLPEHHLSSETRDVVRLGMGLLATMAALVLGLLIASAKGSYDAQSHELTQVAANVMLLDRLLALYGPETKAAREFLRRAVSRGLDLMWPQGGSRPADLDPQATRAEGFYDEIQALTPQSDAQRSLRAEALRISTDLGRTRWLVFAQEGSSIPFPFLTMLIFWIVVIFVSFGLFAPLNTTAVTTLFVCALSVSGAIFLILELDQPFQGFIQVSSGPLRLALGHLGR